MRCRAERHAHGQRGALWQAWFAPRLQTPQLTTWQGPRPKAPRHFSKADSCRFPETDEHGIDPPQRRADAPVAWVSGNGGLGQWRRRAGHMRQRRPDRQRMGLKNRHKHRPSHRACALVAHAAQLASAILAIGFLHNAAQRAGCLQLGLVRRFRHGLMAVMRCWGFIMLSQADMRQGGCVVRTALRHGHPDARPQPQRHQAQQEAKEKSAHGQIISQAQVGQTGQARTRCSKAALEASSPATSPETMRAWMSLASTLPSSTPH